MVNSSDRAETLADYLQNVQWAVRPATLVDKPDLHPRLNVRDSPVSFSELQQAVKSLKDGKACGPDDIPVEYWKVVLTDKDCIISRWLLGLCNACLARGVVPDDWHQHRVALVFKNGDPADCGNYRPICLLNIAYKVLAKI